MAQSQLKQGAVLDGFRLESLVHKGGMARLWRVSRDGEPMSLIMKVPILGEGEDPAAIVGFEMEQMILPRLSGPHVPKFIAAGDFAKQPYIVMELPSLLKRLPELPLLYEEVSEIGVKIAAALHAIHRQHVIHLDIKPNNVIIGARQNSLLRKLLGGVSAKVAAEAACTVTVVRPPRQETSAKHAETPVRESSTA
jgi:eukaryotic-like serine/threonine-protein kinase